MDFKLHAPYSATGDQPEAIEQLTEGLRSGTKEQVLLGVTGSGKTFTMASVIEKLNRPTLVLAHNHPSGVALPSADDVQTTRRIAAALSAVEVSLIDHIVVAEGDFISMIQSGYRFDEYILP